MTAPVRLTMLGFDSVGLCIGIVDCAGSGSNGSGVADAMGEPRRPRERSSWVAMPEYRTPGFRSVRQRTPPRPRLVAGAKGDKPVERLRWAARQPALAVPRERQVELQPALAAQLLMVAGPAVAATIEAAQAPLRVCPKRMATLLAPLTVAAETRRPARVPWVHEAASNNGKVTSSRETFDLGLLSGHAFGSGWTVALGRTSGLACTCSTTLLTVLGDFGPPHQSS